MTLLVVEPHLGYHAILKLVSSALGMSDVGCLYPQLSQPRAKMTQRVAWSFNSAETEKLHDERPVEPDNLPSMECLIIIGRHLPPNNSGEGSEYHTKKIR